MIKWEDSTRYRQGDNIKIPTSYKCTLGDIDVSIHQFVGCGNGLYLSSNKLHIKAYGLDTNDYEEAKKKAIDIIYGYLDNKIKIYQNAMIEIEKDGK